MDRPDSDSRYSSRHEVWLCSPGLGLSCFACCPPIRPAGYDHYPHRRELRREFILHRQHFIAGRLPKRPLVGFTCPGLGFLDPGGRRVGCLLHPARNQGRDLREVTGYRDKCARESCPETRAFRLLSAAERACLLEPCRGMDPFQFSSRGQNPLMRLLALGPEVARQAAGLGGGWPAPLQESGCLDELEPSRGWLLARLLERRGKGFLRRPGLAGVVEELAGELRLRLMPQPPLEAGGEPLGNLCDEWEARWWRVLLGRRQARWEELEGWRRVLAGLLDELGNPARAGI